MKTAFRILFYLLLTATGQIAMAQTRLTVSQALDFWITTTENEVVPAADAMPEEKYSFAPTHGEFTGVRTFAQQVKHLAANNIAWPLTSSPSRLHLNKNPRLGPTQSNPKLRSWTTSKARSRRCIGLWLPSTTRTWSSRWRPFPVHGRRPVFSSQRM